MFTATYSINATVKNSPEEAFSAIIHHIPDWWSREFEGAGNKEGDSFTVRFGSHDQSYKTMKIAKLTTICSPRANAVSPEATE